MATTHSLSEQATHTYKQYKQVLRNIALVQILRDSVEEKMDAKNVQSWGHGIRVQSLTQFYSFGFLHAKISLRSAFLRTHNQGLRQLFGSLHLSTTNLTVSLYL